MNGTVSGMSRCALRDLISSFTEEALGSAPGTSRDLFIPDEEDEEDDRGDGGDDVTC